MNVCVRIRVYVVNIQNQNYEFGELRLDFGACSGYIRLSMEAVLK
jgi:hypothetical protein